MSNQKNLTLDGFRGINRRAKHDEPYASDIVNFRIRSDGSLEKRCGYRPLVSLRKTPRAWIVSSENGTPMGYALLDDEVVSVDLSTGAISNLGFVNTEDGPACFFFDRGTLYLTDGEDLYAYDAEDFVPCYGYVPLLGKDWKNNEVGPIHEPKNVLNRHVRITYRIADPPSGFLCVGEPIESVEAVYQNGRLLSADEYYIDDACNSVNVYTQPLEGYCLTVYVTLKADLSQKKDLLCQATNALLFGDADNHRLFLWGMEDYPATVFCSDFVSEKDLEESKKHYPKSDLAYFPKGFDFVVGDGKHKLQNAVRQQDRLLFFTEGEAWMSQADTSGAKDFPTVCVHPSIGCATDGGATLAGNDPVSVGDFTVWRWEKDSDHTGGYHGVSLSAPIDESIDPQEYSKLRVFYDFRENELWLFHPQSGNIRICHLPSGNWYRFEGISADCFFHAKDTTGFRKGNELYLFDRTLKEDQKSDGSTVPIHAVYQSGFLDFGTAERKNLSHLALLGDTDGGTVSVSFHGDECATVSCELSAEDTEPPHILLRRIASGRFRTASFTLNAPDGCRQVIRRLELYTR